MNVNARIAIFWPFWPKSWFMLLIWFMLLKLWFILCYAVIFQTFNMNWASKIKEHRDISS